MDPLYDKSRKFSSERNFPEKIFGLENYAKDIRGKVALPKLLIVSIE